MARMNIFELAARSYVSGAARKLAYNNVGRIGSRKARTAPEYAAPLFVPSVEFQELRAMGYSGREMEERWRELLAEREAAEAAAAQARAARRERQYASTLFRALCVLLIALAVLLFGAGLILACADSAGGVFVCVLTAFVIAAGALGLRKSNAARAIGNLK